MQNKALLQMYLGMVLKGEKSWDLSYVQWKIKLAFSIKGFYLQNQI